MQLFINHFQADSATAIMVMIKMKVTAQTKNAIQSNRKATIGLLR